MTVPFEAKIFIQGTGVYVPHTEGNRVWVLFPSWQAAHDLGLRDPTDLTQPICRHSAVVEYDARNRDPSAASAWISQPDRWAGRSISVESDSRVEMALGDEGIPGVPRLDVVADAADIELGAPVRADLLDRTGDMRRLLAADLFLDRGVVGPSSEYQGAWQFIKGERDIAEKGYYSSVIRIELGELTRFALRSRRYDGGEEVLELYPIGDELDVWVRYYCDVGERPSPEDDTCDMSEAPDVDFALNFSLASAFERLVLGVMPVPKPLKSWEGGGPVGGDCHRCMCSGTEKSEF